MRMFTRGRVVAVLALAAASATFSGVAAQAVLNDLEVDVEDVIDDVTVEALSDLVSVSDLANDLHVLSCDQTNIISNEGDVEDQENEQTNRCSISVVKVKDVLNDLSIEDLLEGGVNVLTEGD